MMFKLVRDFRVSIDELEFSRIKFIQNQNSPKM